ncbi:LLM class F420-dependent oxidoreductase [Mycobacterium sp. CBMA293]|uniref:LLM class F420-dependent oxidoreductase n=1 Tax=unclassified Mycolicibacterium TaxID=2636767 RepID=UPI0012DFD565|nr:MULTISPECIES: LLM class F420-dependent oxidoreductase [unclassified Mycolicibacterium]MUL49639.1 LLM class F420-dependent oxidoreductase [Mycolicibacterium sp. CBMA 360]MUL61527.1 LLM class F420-dependent oxidoreductase [Mycolicibacterium sp. CBMA 335]MUL74262.1 LLM class F420-dependent oxidoreductase [Mycolicibacterium sp. CBMA 311]MUL97112.1 LLM class F420-dependent oxidoreductase [Mycolicibacterium sp. CBMA 230]MUM04302.1 F420-dependent oxidoreductase [Mycolicibacterium sp. CBMA 213]
MTRDFRFGFGLRHTDSRSAVQDASRRAEDLGYDVLLVPDHLGAPAPFPVLATAAMATNTMHVGTFVFNACFYKPALLARDVAAMHDLTEGRFETGLGAGYVQAEFDAAELPFPSAGKRVEYLAHVTTYLRTHLPQVPVMIAGAGDKLLTVAAQYAQIIGLIGGGPHTADHDPLAERISFVRNAAGARFDELELNLAITAVPTDGSGMPNLSITRRFLPELSDAELLKTPGALSGSTTDMADRIRALRDRYGVSYFTVQQQHSEAFAQVIAELR